MTEVEYIASLVLKQLSSSLNEAKRQELNGWLAASPVNQTWYNNIQQEENLRQLFFSYNSEQVEASRQRVFAHIQENIQKQNNRSLPSDEMIPVRSIPLYKRTWFKYAAAIIMVCGTGILSYLYLINSNHSTQVSNTIPVNIINPGRNTAVLTLADGSVIDLDSAANGQLAQQGRTSIIKNASGQILYADGHPDANKTEAAVMNTMITPHGGQYQLTLADGTKVWLNAASSITYPAAFTGSDRVVSISGEVYFEVEKDRRPFIVQTPSDKIEVLGTEFNVNAYLDEQSVKTSLIHGSVKINSDILKPGQAYAKGKIMATDIVQDIAWKNGFFAFHDDGIQAVMRQLARWYNVDIKYAGKIPDVQINGKISRNLVLQDVLSILVAMRIHYQINNRTITILPE